MPYLSKREIEAIATRVVNAYQRMVGTTGTMIQRVCPEILIRNLLGLNITYRTLSIDGSILGMTAFDQVGVRVYENKNPTHFYLDGKTVLIESALTEPDANPGRLHFTLVHEASHQILKMLFPKEYAPGINHRHVYCCTDSSVRHGGRQVDWEEWRVNMLTAAILMPLDLLVKQMEAVGLDPKIRMLNRVFAPKEYQAFATVAENLGVADSAFPEEVDVALDFRCDNIHELNELALAVEKFSILDRKKLGAAVSMAKPEKASQIRRLAENMDLFEFAPGAHTPAEYGKYMIQKSGHFEYDPTLDEFYDYERYGLQHMDHQSGVFTDYGYIAYVGTVNLEELMAEDPIGQHQREQGIQMGGMA